MLFQYQSISLNITCDNISTLNIGYRLLTSINLCYHCLRIVIFLPERAPLNFTVENNNITADLNRVSNL